MNEKDAFTIVFLVGFMFAIASDAHVVLFSSLYKSFLLTYWVSSRYLTQEEQVLL